MLLLLMGGTFCIGYAVADEPITLSFEAEHIAGLQVLPVEGASGGKVARIGNDIGLWGWATMPLGREIPAGSYRVTVRSLGSLAPTSRTLCYWVSDKRAQLPANGIDIPRYTDQAFHEDSFDMQVTTPCSTIILKHGPDKDQLGPMIDWIKITAIPYTPPTKIFAYHRLLALPNISGIDTTIMEKKVAEAEIAGREGNDQVFSANIATVERWLDLMSDITDCDQRVRYLGQVVQTPELRLKSQQTHTRQLENQLLVVKDKMNLGDVTAAAALLTPLHDNIQQATLRIEQLVGGKILPDTQGDPFTWLKSPILQGMVTYGTGTDTAANQVTGTFTSEPTPFSFAWFGGPTIDFATPDTRFTVDRTWTETIWRSDAMTMRISTFSPAIQVSDSKEFLVKGANAVTQLDGTKALLLKGDSWMLLLDVSAGAIQTATQDNGVRVMLPTQAAAWLLPVRNTDDAYAWMKILPQLPESVVQVQRGNLVTQYFNGTGNRMVAPIAPMLQWGVTCLANTAYYPRPAWKISSAKVLGGKWGKPIYAGEFNFQLPFAYLTNTRRFSYTLPIFSNRPLAGRRGVNVWSKYTTPEDLAALKKDGASYIRMVILDPPAKVDDLSDWLVQQHIPQLLTACRSLGIKANVDPHFLDLHTDTEQSYVDFWRNFVTACADYRDAIGAYDLMNEPKTSYEAVDKWYDWVAKASAVIRKVDASTPLLVEAPRWSNPTGFPIARTVNVGPVLYGVHTYYPHSFTHQAILAKPESPENAPMKAYPSWLPIWGGEGDGWRDSVEWWDRWSLRGQCLPVYRWWIEKGCPPLDNGEFGVVGYAYAHTPSSITRWTVDVMNMNNDWHASWELYAYTQNSGFGCWGLTEPVLKEFWNAPQH